MTIMLEKLLYDLEETDDWRPKQVEACCEVRCCPSATSLNVNTCTPSGLGGGFTQTVGPGPSNALVNFPNGGPTLTFTSTSGRTLFFASINVLSTTESAFFQFEVDGTLVGPVYTTNEGEVLSMLFSSTLGPGTHTVSVRVTNGAGVTTIIGSAVNNVGGWLAVNAC